eukprot:CAMPEP_0114132036 /NCGR_PEP_ID=MMETSP0043_2-20121206/12877_1 /TAXON_ID=464988 /ORGANISM="Hemiselmis andersenii, Strain CCMP644" /LENGTH=333 /DNA_ID=CAMNT_0001225517 /DNA_START=54 /DNA_END=1056 /DNA_ORIENTATION=-
MPGLPTAKNVVQGGYHDAYSGDKDKRAKTWMGWFQSLPVSQTPLATNQCLSVLLVAQILGIIVHIVLLGHWGNVTEVMVLHKEGVPYSHRTLIAIAVFARETPMGEFEVRTQTFSARKSAVVDPMFVDRIESFSAVVSLDENPIGAITRELMRPVHEGGMGLTQPDIAKMSVLGMSKGDVEYQYTVRDNTHAVQTHRDRWYGMHEPYLYIQALKGTKPWVGVGFPVLVPFEVSKQMGEGPLQGGVTQPMEYAGAHYPFLLRVTGDLVNGALKADRQDVVRTALVESRRKMGGDGVFENDLDPALRPTVTKTLKRWGGMTEAQVLRWLNATGDL